jgi:hypothetical protein
MLESGDEKCLIIEKLNNLPILFEMLYGINIKLNTIFLIVYLVHFYFYFLIFIWHYIDYIGEFVGYPTPTWNLILTIKKK